MDAASEKAFDTLSHRAALALWPGEVRIAGVDYAAAVARGPVALETADLAGQVVVDGITAEIAKDALADCPPVETAVLFEGSLYLVRRTDGHGVNDTAWILVCTKDARK